MKTTLTFLVFFLLLGWQARADGLPDSPHLIVSGECELRTTPDTLTLTLSIAETGFEVAAARDSVESRSRKLLTALAAMGIARQDISSAQLQITPHYNWNNSVQIHAGTEVARTIEVILRDLSRYDQLIRSIIDARVAQIQSTVLSSSKEKELREAALQGAIADGTDKARLMVAQLPVQLGPVYSISAQGGAPALPMARYGVSEMADQSAFEPGTIVFRESLQLVFLLLKKE